MGGVSGYTPAPETGVLGWSTIFNLVKGLQHDLGISPIVENSDEAIVAAYDAKITPNWDSWFSKNIIQLIQGAFWCKVILQGIGPGGFDGI